jgi:hypothetical protein
MVNTIYMYEGNSPSHVTMVNILHFKILNIDNIGVVFMFLTPKLANYWRNG